MQVSFALDSLMEKGLFQLTWAINLQWAVEKRSILWLKHPHSTKMDPISMIELISLSIPKNATFLINIIESS